MDSSVSPKDEIWFLRVCHHIANAVYLFTVGMMQMTAVSGLAVMNCLYVPHIVSVPVAQTYPVKCY